MTQSGDAPLGFCEGCGAKRVVAGQSHCVSCGQKLFQWTDAAGGAARTASPAAPPPQTAQPGPFVPPPPPADQAPWTGPATYYPMAPAQVAASRSGRGRMPLLIGAVVGIVLVAMVVSAGGIFLATSARPAASPTTSEPAATLAATDNATPTTVPTASPTAAPALAITYGNPKRYRVEYDATVTNQNFTLTKLQVYQARPIEWDSQKDLVVEAVSPTPTQIGTDSVYGNGMYYWLSSGPKRGNSMQFKVQFTFTAYETTAAGDPAKAKPYKLDDPQYVLYTRSERFIETSDPQIIEVANQVAGSETNPYRLARKFYDYVIKTVSYKEEGKPGTGAKAMLTYGQGDCGDYSELFTALARAKGIPARTVVGYWATSGLNQAHVWAEFYVEGVGWIPVDANSGQASGDPDGYFGHLDNKRVVLNKGVNIPLVPTAPDNAVASSLQMPWWWFWGSSGDSNSVSMQRTEWTVTPIG